MKLWRRFSFEVRYAPIPPPATAAKTCSTFEATASQSIHITEFGYDVLTGKAFCYTVSSYQAGNTTAVDPSGITSASWLAYPSGVETNFQVDPAILTANGPSCLSVPARDVTWGAIRGQYR